MGRHLAVGCLARRASRPSRGPRAPPPPLGDGGPGERDRHRETDRVDCARIVHVTETCDEDAAHLVTDVLTCPAMQPDMASTADIHRRLADKGLLPAEHFVDSAYVDAALLVGSRRDHDVSLEGPVRAVPRRSGPTSSATSRSTGNASGSPARGAR